jgi:SNF2 family DNA or RNA helicase
MGLNLQTARVLVFYGMLPNPARMEQILGRIRRAGSPYANVAAITLISQGTVEEGIYDVILERNAVKDVFWREESVLFEQLGEERLVQLIRGYTP